MAFPYNVLLNGCSATSFCPYKPYESATLAPARRRRLCLPWFTHIGLATHGGVVAPTTHPRCTKERLVDSRLLHFLFSPPLHKQLQVTCLGQFDAWRLHISTIYLAQSPTMSGSHLCCTHPQQRIDSPEPPARPLASFDGIFAAAALPEDHPHALKFPDRKPELDQSIVKSPTITSKLKQQFRRKSMRSLKKDKEYDEDANRMSSREVLHSVEESPVKIPLDKDAVPGQRFGSVPDLGRAESLDADTAILDARVAKLRSCEYLKPLLQK